MEDSPQRLVLEEWVARWLGGAGLLLPAGVLLFGGIDLDKPFMVFDRAVSPWWFAGAFSLGMLWMALERDRIVFDAEAGTLRRTLRVARWSAFERPLTEIERVDVSSKSSTIYGEDKTDHFLNLVFKDGKKLLVNQSADLGYLSRLASRIGQFRDAAS